MRFLIMTALLCLAGAGSEGASAQPAATERPAATALPDETAATRKRDHDAAVANCVSMWDGATHMTQQQWLRTCRRVQDRLQTLQMR